MQSKKDLNFDDDGNPTNFEHRRIYDCICAAGSDHICSSVQDSCSGPEASKNAVTHVQHIARLRRIVLVFINSKVNANMEATLGKADSAVVPFLDSHLCDHGYQGKVIISSATIQGTLFLHIR
ncbi:unnamed protein product [Rotaria socialis]|uniref:Uncharacterized protein n=1 Tax=Rotaria socialis TaxID=392032 RepID=A0A820IW88_9BILA|nr:unnamed protein product [Rotaria socialis]CAF3391824.1 unnamed protein product [Rotaria socialis]CAF3630290.1 unnamed protein product [Rotaria socialis]CAF3749623.1 unnamed protein product [Rotaria socialis]CAF3781191.1 unnamed protein product [Rotaria socialis]